MSNSSTTGVNNEKTNFAYLTRAGTKTKVNFMWKRNLVLLGYLMAGAEAFSAVPTAPSVKPPIVYESKVVNTPEIALFHDALTAGKKSDWGELERLYSRTNDPIIRDFILWRLATGGRETIGFDSLNLALGRLGNWPSFSRIRSASEKAMRDGALLPAQKVEWFEQNGEATTGDGLATHALALSDLGQLDGAIEKARQAWRTTTFSRDTEKTLLARFGGQFSTEDHETRANFLLWGGRGYSGAAGRLRSKVSNDYRKLMDARLALIARRGRGVDAKVAAVPAHLSADAGLLFDRARWRRRRAGNQAGATSLLVQINGADVPPNGQDNLWDERNIAARVALKAQDFDTAYRLSAPHGMTAGADFAEAEWMAGWVALRHLGQPEKALGHFEALQAGVSTPISLSRALYWQGRALEDLGQQEDAEAIYTQAAAYNYAYYGQLAAERISDTLLELPTTPEPTEEERAEFMARPVIQVLRLLGEANESGLFRQFAYSVDDQLQTPTEQLLLAEIGLEYQAPDVGVRGGKAGLGRGIIAPEAAYPVVSYNLRREAQVENALVLALSRQESELNPRARSHANARGLMQMLPSTAKSQARREGLPYRVSWLVDDPGYNMTLGAAHLDDLLDTFNGSYAMTAAAYNAGASRPKRWIVDYGDPRKGEIDPIDWVEFIPFSETRNYVQRVLENVQVYRHRLNGQATVIDIENDLRRGKLN